MPEATDQRRRSDQVWAKRAPWDALYREAYEFAIPQRRPGGAGKTKRVADRIFDMTAAQSAAYFAGNLQRDLFPAGAPPFTWSASPLVKARLGPQQTALLERILEREASRVHPFFLGGDWDTAIHETCIDLSVGTGAIMPVKGTSSDPVAFVAIPFDELAIATDAIGRINTISWKQSLAFEQIKEAFPSGTFDDDFKNRLTNSPYDETELRQDFFRQTDGTWKFVAYCEKSTEFITTDTYRSQPIAVPRYYRVPGEAYGRGPVLLALPSIKTLNKAQELALKSAAIQMLGIWGYRAGGTFNPDTVRVGAGEFWPMQSTGGVLGPDVSRIDPASGRLDVARMVIGNLRDDIKAALYDTRLPERQGATPLSASEIVGRMKQKAEVHIGAFGRLVREIMPVIVPRVCEILYGFGYLNQMPLDRYLVATEVRSPMAAALNADRLASIGNYLEFVGAVAGPQAVPLYAHIDRVLDRVAEGLHIEKELIPTPEERAELQKQQMAQQVAAMALQAGADSATTTPQESIP